jgi:signal-transduction protein with cAMP-binding, CBS, and nucleotidyltransferase domain
MSSVTDQLSAVFAGHEPFRSLDPGSRAATLASAAVYDSPADDAILVQDGPPAQSLWIVLDGSVALLHEGQAIGVLGPGEYFGHPSLLSGMGPAFTVRTREIVRCGVMARAAAEAVLATPAGAAYVAATMRWRLALQIHTVRGLPDVGTTPVSAIMRPPVFLARSSTVCEAVRRLSDRGVLAVFVHDAEATGVTGAPNLAMITDAEIRSALSGGTLELDAPVSSLWRHPAPTVPLRRRAVEAAVDMLAAHSDCMAVIDSGAVAGVLGTADLAGLDARSPIALRHTLLGAADEAGLERAAALIGPLFVLLAEAGAWRMSKAQWIATFNDCLKIPDASHLLRATVSFDFRSAAGSLSLTTELSERVRQARQHPRFLHPMARLGSSFSVALNRRGQRQTGRRGDPAGCLDLKRGAIVLDRIEVAQSLGALDGDSTESLREAFNVICSVRLRHHAQQISAGLTPDNLIAPDTLGPVARADLTGALKSVRLAQRQLENLTSVSR